MTRPPDGWMQPPGSAPSDTPLTTSRSRFHTVEQFTQYAAVRVAQRIDVVFRFCLRQKLFREMLRQRHDSRIVEKHGRGQLDADELLGIPTNRHRHHGVEAQLSERPVQVELGLWHVKFAGKDGAQSSLQF